MKHSNNIKKRIGHYQKLPSGWAIAPMQTLCSLTDGEKQSDIKRINLDVKYLRGEREAKTLTTGKYVAANSLLILVDGEKSTKNCTRSLFCKLSICIEKRCVRTKLVQLFLT